VVSFLKNRLHDENHAEEHLFFEFFRNNNYNVANLIQFPCEHRLVDTQAFFNDLCAFVVS